MRGQEIKLFQKLREKKGQIAVEYILLVGISVVIAATVVSLMVSRDSEEPGFLIRTWQSVVDTISADPTGEPQ